MKMTFIIIITIFISGFNRIDKTLPDLITPEFPEAKQEVMDMLKLSL